MDNGKNKLRNEEIGKYETIYKKILEDIIAKRSEKEHEYLNDLSLSLAQIAYVMRDIDENGVKELIIYDPSEDKNLIYESYTIKDGKAKNLTNTTETKRVYLTDDDGFLEVWEEDEDEWGEDRYRFDENGEGLEFLDRVVYDRDHAEEYYKDKEISESDCFFYTDKDPDDKENYQPVSQKEAEEKRAENEKSKADINGGTTLDEYETDVKPPEEKPAADNKITPELPEEKPEADNIITPELSEDIEVPQEYVALIEKYIDTYPWEHVEIVPDVWLNLDYAACEKDEVGYCVMDINGDKTPELLMGVMGEYEDSIIDIFTIREGVVVSLLSGGGRTHINVLNNGTLEFTGITAMMSETNIYEIKNGERVLVETLYHDLLVDSRTYTVNGKETQLTEQEYRMQLDKYVSSYVDIKLSTIMDYAE